MLKSGVKWLFIWIFILVFSELYSAQHEVFPENNTEKINLILGGCRAGDTVIFHPGIYTGPFIMSNVNGLPNQSIVIKSDRSGGGIAVIDGQTEPGMGKQNNAFSLENCSWIVIEGFTIQNCWTDLITASDVSYLSLKSCDLTGGKRAVFAEGRGSHHFLIENCRWQQDARVWTHEEDYSWEEIHHGVHRHFNGSLFQGSRISGVFVIRNNHIKNTFNAFRLSQINDGSTDSLACSNGEVYGNFILNTSDNVFEPEVYCHNLHFYHNHMINGHALISVTDVGGGPIYLYGNTGLSEPDCEDGWSIFKLSSPKRSLSEPFYIFNNSWQVDYNFVGDYNIWRNSNAVHFNNAYILENTDTFGLDNTGDNNSFDYDCSSIPFPVWFKEKGVESNGIEADPMYRDPLDGDFRLQEGSPCIDKGLLKNDLILSFEGEAPDIGAWEGNRLVDGPAFRFSDPMIEVPYKEHSRITKYRISDNELTLWFSVPISREEILKAEFSLHGTEAQIPLSLSEAGKEGYRYNFSFRQEFDSGSEIKLYLHRWPNGENGMEMCGWASAIPVLKTK